MIGVRPQQPGWRPHRGTGCYAETGGGCKTPHPRAHNLAKRRKESGPRELPPGTQPRQGACVMLAEAPGVLLPWHGPRGAFHDTDPPLPSPPLPSPPSSSSPSSHSRPAWIPPSACPLPVGFHTHTPVQQAHRLSSTSLSPVAHTHTHTHTHTYTHTNQSSYSDNLPYHILYSRAIASREKHECSNVTMTIRGRHRERRLTHPSLL